MYLYAVIVTACSHLSHHSSSPLLEKTLPSNTVQREFAHLCSMDLPLRACSQRKRSKAKLATSRDLGAIPHVPKPGTAIFFSSARPAMPSSADPDAPSTSTTSGGNSAHLSAHTDEPSQVRANLVWPPYSARNGRAPAMPAYRAPLFPHAAQPEISMSYNRGYRNIEADQFELHDQSERTRKTYTT